MGRFSWFVVALFFAAIIAAGQPAGAASYVFTTQLFGSNEVPPNASPGFGTGSFTYDDVANDLFYDIVYGGLMAPVVAAHIHAAPEFVVGPVVHTFSPATSPIQGVWNDLSAQNVQDLFAGSLYVNVHTTQFPGGEIRGQITAVPEAGTLALALSGFAGLGALRWRRSLSRG